MQKNVVILAIILVAATLGIVFVYDQFSPQEAVPEYDLSKTREIDRQVSTPKEPAAVHATGSIEGITQSLLLDASVDESEFAEEEADSELVGSDSQAIGDFGQSYNENEL